MEDAEKGKFQPRKKRQREPTEYVLATKKQKNGPPEDVVFDRDTLIPLVQRFLD
jgi:hypothetical protein